MLFRWRRDDRCGALCAPVASGLARSPVKLADDCAGALVELRNPATRFSHSCATAPAVSVIGVRVADAVVRVKGEVDVVRLRVVLPAVRE